jgi:hypothetical protein
MGARRSDGPPSDPCIAARKTQTTQVSRIVWSPQVEMARGNPAMQAALRRYGAT